MPDRMWRKDETEVRALGFVQRWRKPWFFLLLLTVLLAACTTVPITERRQLDLVSDEAMLAASRQAYQEFLAGHEVVRGTAESEMVEKAGRRIQRAVEEFLARRDGGEVLQEADWEFNLIDSPEVNAWAMPGGKVAVYSGMLPIARDEAGLAVVIGHEIAHIVAGHGQERMSQQLVAQMGGQALSALLAQRSPAVQNLVSQAYGIGATVGVMLPYSRLQEKEADRLGLIFMAMAGYDPEVAVDFWQRMARKKEGGSPPELLSTHPADQTRIEEIREAIPEAMKYYQPR